jgi:hypothetical protein
MNDIIQSIDYANNNNNNSNDRQQHHPEPRGDNKERLYTLALHTPYDFESTTTMKNESLP